MNLINKVLKLYTKECLAQHRTNIRSLIVLNDKDIYKQLLKDIRGNMPLETMVKKFWVFTCL